MLRPCSVEVGFGGDAAEGSPAFAVEEAFEDRASFLGLAVVEIPIADTVLHGVVGREIPASQCRLGELSFMGFSARKIRETLDRS